MQRIGIWLCGMMFCLAGWLHGSRLGAQSRSAGPAPAAVLDGAVADSAGRRIPGADVVIGSIQRRVRTNANGEFRFDGIDPGAYDVVVLAVGYYPEQRAVAVAAAGTTVHFVLAVAPRTLPAVITSASRGGLSGTVGDTAHAPIADAEVTVLGQNLRVSTDSSGAFFVDVKPGRYMCRSIASRRSRSIRPARRRWDRALDSAGRRCTPARGRRQSTSRSCAHRHGHAR